RLVDGRPLALMENWLPVTLAQLARKDLEADGLYNLLRRAGVDFRMAHQRVGADVADEEQASQLKAETGSALVVMERT
ncbi:GntR family transcriptional regulator, partial [Pseudomonas sp. 2588-5]